MDHEYIYMINGTIIPCLNSLHGIIDYSDANINKSMNTKYTKFIHYLLKSGCVVLKSDNYRVFHYSRLIRRIEQKN